MFKLNCYGLFENSREFNFARYVGKPLCFPAITKQRNNQTESAGGKNSDMPELSIDSAKLEEEMEKKRIKHRLPDRVYKIFVEKEVPTPLTKIDFQKRYLLKHYGRYGKSSGLNPGIMWPTKEELKDKVHFENQYHLSLQEMSQKFQIGKAERQKLRKDYEEEVDKNMANLDKVLEDYHAKIAQKQAVADELRKKRELLIEEISEYLGYDVDPQDPKFKEAVESKDKERKKAQREKREKENYAKMLQKLSQMADSSE